MPCEDSEKGATVKTKVKIGVTTATIQERPGRWEAGKVKQRDFPVGFGGSKDLLQLLDFWNCKVINLFGIATLRN